MSSSSRRISPVALLTVLALAGAATPAVAKPAPDKAPPVISAVVVTPAAVALAAKKSGTTSFTVSAKVADAGRVDRVVIGIYDAADKKGRSFRLARTAGTALEGTWSVTASLPNTVARGTWSVRAFAGDKASNTSNPDKIYATFQVKHATRLRGLDVSPEPAQPKADLTAGAVLEQYLPGKGWRPYSKRTVVLQFRPDGAKDFAEVISGHTDPAGKVAFTKVKATRTGAWRIAFVGNTAYAGSVSGTDTVKVAAAAKTNAVAPSPGATATGASMPTPSTPPKG